MQGKRRAVVMLKECGPISSPAEEKWLLRVLMLCEQGGLCLVAEGPASVPAELHQCKFGLPMGNVPGEQISVDGLFWMRGDGRVQIELVVYMNSCGPDSPLLVEVAGSHLVIISEVFSFQPMSWPGRCDCCRRNVFQRLRKKCGPRSRIK